MQFSLIVAVIATSVCVPQFRQPRPASREMVVPDRVRLPYGMFQGSSDTKCTSYKGIPYAEPPIGSLRFQPPQDPKPRYGLTDATTFGFGCIQNPTSGGLNGTGLSMNEDCLNLNIFIPKSVPQPLPVVVYIHGGGFNSGYASHPYFDPCKLDHQHITVTFNYRVGIFGFLGSTELAEKQWTNIGLRDQEKVFDWVRKHIHLFGGNPTDVTAYGQSAGAISIATHMMRTKVEPYFQKAILHSGGPGLFMPVVNDGMFNNVLHKTNCTDLECLKQQKADILYKASIGIQYFPYIDQSFVMERAKTAFEQGRVWNIPVQLNTVSQEGLLFTRTVTDDSMANRFMDSQFGFLNGPQRAELLQLYPRNNYSTPSEWVADMYGDAGFQCPSWMLENYFSNKTRVLKSLFSLDNSIHGTDVPYFWHYEPQVSDFELSNRMVRLVDEFVTGKGESVVPTRERKGLVYDIVKKTWMSDERERKCLFWTTV
jgi:para-nitrobenzyl esterase